MKKTNKVKMGPLGTPLGNPLGYFNSLKSKRIVEPKQTLRKAQNGDAGRPEETAVTPEGKPLGANVGIGNFSAGYSGNVGPTALTDSKINAGYNNTNTGFGAKGSYDFDTKSGNAGITYNNNGWGVTGAYDSEKGANAGVTYTGNVGKNKTPVKVGFTYGSQKKGGIIKSKMKTGGLVKKKK
jgi:hypothetical protein